MQVLRVFVLPVFSLGVLISCSTVKGMNYKDDQALMYGMVYDGNEIAVGEVQVYVDNELCAVSDMRGRFILKFLYTTSMDEKKHLVRLEKDGYEIIESEIFYDPMSLLYFRLNSAQELMTQTENYIDKGNYNGGEKCAKKVELIEGYQADGIFLRAVIKIKQGDTLGAKAILTSIETAENCYIKKFLERLK